ncbi:hypothetical protein STENM223S_07462 [Streptomyces tendae]
MPAAEASRSTLATAPPYPTATGVFWSAGPLCGVGGAAAPTDTTTAAETARTVRFRATGRRIRTSRESRSGSLVDRHGRVRSTREARGERGGRPSHPVPSRPVEHEYADDR